MPTARDVALARAFAMHHAAMPLDVALARALAMHLAAMPLDVALARYISAFTDILLHASMQGYL